MIEDLIPRIPRDAASEFEHVIAGDGAVGGTFEFIRPPQPVGTMQIFDGFSVCGYKRPNWLHRTAMRLLLGWIWKDA